MSAADYIKSLSEGYWTKPWKRVHSSETNGFIQFQELPDRIVFILPCCVSVIEPHRPDCRALLAIKSWRESWTAH